RVGRRTVGLERHDAPVGTAHGSRSDGRAGGKRDTAADRTAGHGEPVDRRGPWHHGSESAAEGQRLVNDNRVLGKEARDRGGETFRGDRPGDRRDVAGKLRDRGRGGAEFFGQRTQGGGSVLVAA